MAQTNILLEKVVKGLEKCRRYECDDCTEKGASKAPWDCPAHDDFVDSAFALLKADLQAQREAQAALETEAYMEQWEPTYNPEDGSL